MNNTTIKKLVELLKTGDFSVHYDDNGAGRIVKGKHAYGKGRTVCQFDGNSIGYAPMEVEILVKALGGKVDSV